MTAIITQGSSGDAFRRDAISRSNSGHVMSQSKERISLASNEMEGRFIKMYMSAAIPQIIPDSMFARFRGKSLEELMASCSPPLPFPEAHALSMTAEKLATETITNIAIAAKYERTSTCPQIPFCIISSIVSDPFDISVVYFTGAAYSASSFKEYLDQIEALYATDKPFMLVMNMVQLPCPPSLSYIAEQAQFLMRNWLNIKRCVRCTCLVVENPRLLACIRLLFRIVPNQSPMYVISVYDSPHDPSIAANVRDDDDDDEDCADDDDIAQVICILHDHA